MQFTSPRLTYREFEQDDFPLYYSVFSNEDVIRYAYWDMFPSQEAAQQYYDQLMADREKPLEQRQFFFYAAFTKDGEFAGVAEVEIEQRRGDGGDGNIGYFLLPGYWGGGLATEMAEALCRLCLTELELHRVSACCNAQNAASARVLEKAGMVSEGVLRQARYKNGRWEDELRFGLLKDEWKGE